MNREFFDRIEGIVITVVLVSGILSMILHWR